MSVVHVSTEINAPMEQVWEVVMDPGRLGDWVTIHRSVHSVSDHPLREGATMEQSLRMHGVSFRVKWRLEHVTAPQGRRLGRAGTRAFARPDRLPPVRRRRPSDAVRVHE